MKKYKFDINKGLVIEGYVTTYPYDNYSLSGELEVLVQEWLDNNSVLDFNLNNIQLLSKGQYYFTIDDKVVQTHQPGTEEDLDYVMLGNIKIYGLKGLVYNGMLAFNISKAYWYGEEKPMTEEMYNMIGRLL